MFVLFALACPISVAAVPYPPSEPGKLELDSPARKHLARFADVHPRLYVTADQWPVWRERIKTTHQALWKPVAERLDKYKASPPPGRRWGRGDGDHLAHLAFAWAMTEDPELLATAKKHLLALVAKDVWDPSTDLLHGHLLTGAAVAYDWLYPELTEQERSLVRTQLGKQAELQFRASTSGRGYWRNQFLQNHGHVNLAGLASAAAVLYGDDDRAEKWLALSDWFFRNVFAVSNPDGTSIEGLSYGAYALEYCLRYAELAKSLLGRDYYDCKWFRQWPEYLVHSTLPVMARHNWAMTFGDSPRAAESHLPVHTMFRIAAQYRDGRAQWIGQQLADMLGVGRSTHLCILWHDPTVKPIPREALPTLGHMTDTGQIMMRSGWGADAVMVGLRCGPWQGHAVDGKATRDLGAAHAHPDVNSFQIYGYGKWLAIDPGYTHLKRTPNHSTVLVNGAGQLGEGTEWFSSKDAQAHGHTAKILSAVNQPTHDYVAGDATGAYHPGLGLGRFVRHWLLIKPDVIVVVDDLRAEPTGVLQRHQWDQLDLQNMVVSQTPWPCVIPTAQRCQAGVLFNGAAGKYDIDVSYYDNQPGTGNYQLAVDDKVVAKWRNDVPETDLHTRVFRDVELKPGQRVAVQGRPIGADAKFTKLVICSRSQPRVPTFDWLLHAEPEAAVTQPAEQLVRINRDGVCLDVHLAGGDREQVEVGTWPVVRGSRMKSTQRLRVRPQLSDNSAVMVTVLHVKPEAAETLAEVGSQIDGRDVLVRFRRGDRDVSAKIRLDGHSAEVTTAAR